MANTREAPSLNAQAAGVPAGIARKKLLEAEEIQLNAAHDQPKGSNKALIVHA